MTLIKKHARRKSVFQLHLFDWRCELDRCADDTLAVRLIAKRYRISRTAARLIAEAAGIGGGNQ
jgi:hypothetical protein